MMWEYEFLNRNCIINYFFKFLTIVPLFLCAFVADVLMNLKQL